VATEIAYGDRFDSQCLLPGFQARDDLQARLRHIEQRGEKLDDSAVCRVIDRGCRDLQFQCAIVYADDFVAPCPRLDMESYLESRICLPDAPARITHNGVPRK